MVGTFSPSPARQIAAWPQQRTTAVRKAGLPYASVLAITIAGSTMTRTMAAGLSRQGK
jgi:hypothetical protein